MDHVKGSTETPPEDDIYKTYVGPITFTITIVESTASLEEMSFVTAGTGGLRSYPYPSSLYEV